MKGTIYLDVQTILLERMAEGTYVIPRAMIDYLGDDGDAFAVQTAASSKLIKRYIDGTSVFQAQMRFLYRIKGDADISSAMPLDALETLDRIAGDFAAMNEYRMPSGRVVSACEATTAYIIGRDEHGCITYGVTLTMTYTEEG